MRNTQSNLQKINTSALPGVQRLIGMIGNHNLKNKLIIAFVIACCMSVLLYHYGIISFANAVVPSSPQEQQER